MRDFNTNVVSNYKPRDPRPCGSRLNLILFAFSGHHVLYRWLTNQPAPTNITTPANPAR